MDARFTEEDEAFRVTISTWFEENLCGDFEIIKGRGGPGDEDALFEERHAWERVLGKAGWIGVGWPTSVGGRGLSLTQQMIFHEEYARAGGPGRVGHIGEGLLGPTLIHFGSDEQKQRFLPNILSGEEVWCQGYSEPNAGSDLANVQTRAEFDGDEWVLNGQKVWTSGAEHSDWCFVVCRTDPDAQPKHRGISYILCPMDQPGVEVRPILQMTGDSEFSETFFSDARTAKDNVVGGVNGGWGVAMGTLAFERGASTLGQQMNFQNELDQIIEIAKNNGKNEDPLIRQQIALSDGRVAGIGLVPRLGVVAARDLLDRVARLPLHAGRQIAHVAVEDEGSHGWADLETVVGGNVVSHDKPTPDHGE